MENRSLPQGAFGFYCCYHFFYSFFEKRKVHVLLGLDFRSGNVGGHPSAPRALAFFRAPCSVSFGSMFVLQTPFWIMVRFHMRSSLLRCTVFGRKSEGEKGLERCAVWCKLKNLLFASRSYFSENLEVWRKHVVSLVKYRSMEKTLHIVQIRSVPRPFGCLHVLDGHED